MGYTPIFPPLLLAGTRRKGRGTRPRRRLHTQAFLANTHTHAHPLTHIQPSQRDTHTHYLLLWKDTEAEVMWRKEHKKQAERF